MAAAIVAAAAILFSVTFRFFDYDLWEHLVVGKYIWTAHAIPTTQMWTWPTWGEPTLVPSWGFRALLWPFWSLGGVLGLFAWRWLATVATFGLAFLTSRRIGGDPLVTLVVLALAALTYRGRTMIRPETLALVLLAAQAWILESRRRGGPRRDAWLLAIAVAWINVHISFYLGLVQLAIHAVDEAWGRSASASAPTATGRSRWGLALLVVGAIVVSLLNPFGWRAVVQPFAFVLHGRSEPIYQAVGELGGIDWRLNWRNGLPLLVAGWPLLLAWRARRRGLDLAEALACAFFTLQALASQRFKAAYVVAAAPFVARDLSEWLASRRRNPLSLPVGARAAVTCAAIVGLGMFEWSLPQFPPGVGLDMRYVPVAACDFIERAGVRGRAFNHFWYGGYMEYRFWPRRDRLPFIDGHLESGTEHDRTLYTRAQSDPTAWRELDHEKHFDFAVLTLKTPSGLPLRAAIEADSAWAAVFIDDAAVVFVRRAGALAGVAQRSAYRTIEVTPGRLEQTMARCEADTALRRLVAAELERQVAESPYTAVARQLLAEIALMDGRVADARAELERALVADPGARSARERLREIP